MDYVGLFNAPPLGAILLSILQTATIYFLVLCGLKLVGRRVFSEQGPQDLVILVLIAEACDLGLTDENAGYWGSIVSVITILLLGWLCERVDFLRRFFESGPVILYKDGRLFHGRMKKFMVDVADLDMTAHERGLENYTHFKEIYLEGDGKITGVERRS